MLPPAPVGQRAEVGRAGRELRWTTTSGTAGFAGDRARRQPLRPAHRDHRAGLRPAPADRSAHRPRRPPDREGLRPARRHRRCAVRASTPSTSSALPDDDGDLPRRRRRRRPWPSLQRRRPRPGSRARHDGEEAGGHDCAEEGGRDHARPRKPVATTAARKPVATTAAKKPVATTAKPKAPVTTAPKPAPPHRLRPPATYTPAAGRADHPRGLARRPRGPGPRHRQARVEARPDVAQLLLLRPVRHLLRGGQAPAEQHRRHQRRTSCCDPWVNTRAAVAIYQAAGWDPWKLYANRCPRGTHRRLDSPVASARSSMDRASDYGSKGWGFESLRAR